MSDDPREAGIIGNGGILGGIMNLTILVAQSQDYGWGHGPWMMNWDTVWGGLEH